MDEVTCECESGFYNTDSLGCVPCAANSVSVQGSKSPSDCKCIAGYVGLEGLASSPCSIAPIIVSTTEPQSLQPAGDQALLIFTDGSNISSHVGSAELFENHTQVSFAGVPCAELKQLSNGIGLCKTAPFRTDTAAFCDLQARECQLTIQRGGHQTALNLGVAGPPDAVEYIKAEVQCESSGCCRDVNVSWTQPQLHGAPLRHRI